MSAFKKVAGLVAGVSAMGAIGVAIAQGVPPNPYVTNPALGAGEQTVHLTPIGETGVLAWTDTAVQQTATLTKENEQVAVVQPAQDTQPVASSSTTTESTQVAQAPAADTSNNTQAMGAGPAPQEDNNASAPVEHKARRDRG